MINSLTRRHNAFEQIKTPAKREKSTNTTTDDSIVSIDDKENHHHIIKSSRDKNVRINFKKMIKNKKGKAKVKGKGKQTNGNNDNDLGQTLPITIDDIYCQPFSYQGLLNSDTTNTDKKTVYEELMPPCSPEYIAKNMSSIETNDTSCTADVCLKDLTDLENTMNEVFFTSNNGSDNGNNLKVLSKGQISNDIKEDAIKDLLFKVSQWHIATKGKDVFNNESSPIHAPQSTMNDYCVDNELTNTTKELISWFQKEVDMNKDTKSKVALKDDTSLKTYDVGTELQYKTPKKLTGTQTTLVVPSHEHTYCEILTSSPVLASSFEAFWDSDRSINKQDDNAKDRSTDEFVSFQFNEFMTNELHSSHVNESGDFESNNSGEITPKELTFGMKKIAATNNQFNDKSPFGMMGEGNEYANFPLTNVTIKDDSFEWFKSASPSTSDDDFSSQLTLKVENYKNSSMEFIYNEESTNMSSENNSPMTAFPDNESVLMNETFDMIHSLEELVKKKSKSSGRTSDIDHHDDSNFRHLLKSMVKEIVLGYSPQDKKKNDLVDLASPVDTYVFPCTKANDLTSPDDVSAFPCTKVNGSLNKMNHEEDSPEMDLKKLTFDDQIQVRDKVTSTKQQLSPMQAIPTIAERIASLQMHLRK